MHHLKQATLQAIKMGEESSSFQAILWLEFNVIVSNGINYVTLFKFF
jgi:hypothetical protein